MWFKNLQVYRLPAPWAFTAEQLEEALRPFEISPAASNEMLRQGWDKPRPNGGLVHVVNGQMLIQLGAEKKLLPATVINQVAKARAAEMEEAQGFAPGKKAMKELKERVADELLPRAFSIRSNVRTWFDPVNGWLVVDAASPAKADDVVKMLLKAVDRMPLESLRVQRSPVGAMTEWLQADDSPSGFTVDMDTELRATGEGKAAVRYVRHTLEADEVRRHIAAGKQCTRLAMTWESKISFTLTESLALKGIKPLDVLKETDASTRNDDERFDGDFMLMTGELNKLLADVVGMLGGDANSVERADREQRKFAPAAPPAVGAPAPATSPSPAVQPAAVDGAMLERAITYTRTQGSISEELLARHLSTNPEHAGDLLRTMEGRGVVGTRAAGGERTVLVKEAAA